MSAVVDEVIEGMALDEFIQTFGQHPFELLEGEIVPMTPQVLRSSMIEGWLYRKLADFSENQQLGMVFIQSPFAIMRPMARNWVKGSRVPDLMFVSQDRLNALIAADPQWHLKPLTIVPDLAVEVVSPTDRFSQIIRKVRLYLRDGIKVVWIIDPDEQSVLVYTLGKKEYVLLGLEDTLTGEDLLPSFELPLEKLFASIQPR